MIDANGRAEGLLATLEDRTRARRLRSWAVAKYAAGVAGRCAIGDRQTRSGGVSVIAGLKAVEKTGGAPLEAELYRLKGEALLAGAGTPSEAEAALQQGIDVARRQNAKSWELRAAMSLARLRQQQSRPQEAVALLAPIYPWVTQGLDTAAPQ